MYSGKDLAELSGYTSRVYSLLASLHALDNGIYAENPRPTILPEDEVSSSKKLSILNSVRLSTTCQTPPAPLSLAAITFCSKACLLLRLLVELLVLSEAERS